MLRLRLKVSGCGLKGLLKSELNSKWVISVVVIVNLIKTASIHVCLQIFNGPNVLVCKHAGDYWFQSRLNWKCVANRMCWLLCLLSVCNCLCGVEGSNFYMRVVWKENQSKTDIVNLLSYPYLLPISETILPFSVFPELFNLYQVVPKTNFHR